MSLRQKQVSGWSAAIVIIVVASLVPVVWIVLLSLKTPATATDGSFIPHAVDAVELLATSSTPGSSPRRFATRSGSR